MKQNMYLTNYSVAVDWCNNNYVLCNRIPQIDPDVWGNMEGLEQLVENDELPEEDFPEIYQWYISDATHEDVRYLIEHFPGLLFTYSEVLECYILCVTHCGTGWDYVEWTTDNPNAEAKLGQRKRDL